MITKLTDFLTDMRNSENEVSVTENQLREYAKTMNGWEILSKSNQITIDKQNLEIQLLKDKLLRLEEIVSIKKLERIDLLA